MNVEKIMDVSKNNFKPTPAVDSVVIRMTPKNIEINEDFLAFCRLIFQHKKKNLYSAILDSRDKLKIKDRNEIRNKLSEISLDTLI